MVFSREVQSLAEAGKIPRTESVEFLTVSAADPYVFVTLFS